MNNNFTELYRRYADSIYRFALFKVGDKDLAWDITQECFLKMWRQILGDITVKNDKALLYTIARNLIIDYWRQKSHKQTAALDSVAHILADDNDLFESQAAGDEIRRLLECVDKLPEDHREIVVLRYVDDLSYSEIADITGKSLVASRVAAHRAVKSLKKLMIKNEN